MEVATDTKYIVREEGVVGGKAPIASHPIGALRLARWYLQGITAEELVLDYPLTHAEVHAALVYYYDHKDEIERELFDEDTAHVTLADADMLPIAERKRRQTHE